MNVDMREEDMRAQRISSFERRSTSLTGAAAEKRVDSVLVFRALDSEAQKSPGRIELYTGTREKSIQFLRLPSCTVRHVMQDLSSTHRLNVAANCRKVGVAFIIGTQAVRG